MRISPQTDQRGPPAHRMRDQKARQMTAKLGRGEGGEILGVSLEIAGARPGRQAARANRSALAAPIQAPYRDPAYGQIAHRLELLFDELAKTADQHALGPRVWYRQMAPAQHRPVGRDKAAPDKARRGPEALGQ